MLTGRQYGAIGFAGLGFLVVTLVALPFLDADLSVVDEYMSVYALGDYGWLLRIGGIRRRVGHDRHRTWTQSDTGIGQACHGIVGSDHDCWVGIPCS